MDMIGHDHIQWYIYFAAAYIICVLSHLFANLSDLVKLPKSATDT